MRTIQHGWLDRNFLYKELQEVSQLARLAESFKRACIFQMQVQPINTTVRELVLTERKLWIKKEQVSSWQYFYLFM